VYLMQLELAASGRMPAALPAAGGLTSRPAA
jgi:hypothetical protein